MSFRGKVFAFMVQSNQFKFSAYKFSTRHLSKMVTLPVKTSIGCMEFGRQCSAEQGRSLEAKMSKALVKTAIGCNELGGGIKSDQVEEFVKLCMEKGIYDFDTAYMYTGGKSEEIMGNISSLHSPEAFIATKANPWTEKGLKYDSVLEQMNVSLERLKKDCVDLFYLHAPDHATPIEETLEAVNHLYREGKFKSFGLSNYASWEVAEIYYLCKQNNYPLPTFYQGMYNSVTRQVEGELFPCLRRFGIAFYAYNPLAGGLLTGKHRFEDRENSMIQHGRFSGTGPWTDLYLKRYWKKPLFNLIDQLKLTLDSIYGVGKVSLVDASIRWMYHHSKMDGANGDAVIIGASSIKHLRENLESTKQGPLHEDVVKIFEEAWGEIKGDCPLYFR